MRGSAGGMGKLLDCVENIQIHDAHTPANFHSSFLNFQWVNGLPFEQKERKTEN